MQGGGKSITQIQVDHALSKHAKLSKKNSNHPNLEFRIQKSAKRYECDFRTTSNCPFFELSVFELSVSDLSYTLILEPKSQEEKHRALILDTVSWCVQSGSGNSSFLFSVVH